jgi:tetratricopeptide (TPR) repeat protein
VRAREKILGRGASHHAYPIVALEGAFHVHMIRRLILSAALAAPMVAQAQETELAGLRAAGRDPASLLRLGRGLRRAGRFDEAVRTLQGATTGPTRADALWEIARVRVDQGVFQAARTACSAFPMPRGNAAESFRRRVCMARAYLVWNRVALAEREIAAARVVNPNDGELQLAIADARRLASDFAAAETAYRAAEEALPGRADPAIGLGLLYEMFQRPDQAQAHFQRALQVDGADPVASMQMGRFLLRRRDAANEALPFLRRAVGNRLAWAEALELLGEALLATGAHAEALRALEESARLSPTQPGVQSSLGRTLAALERYADAEGPLRTAIRLVNTDAAAHMALADVLEHTQRETEAMSTWDAAIDRAPGDMRPRMRAAALAHRTQQNALARAYLDRVLTDDPHSAPALYLRGVIALEEGDRPSAREYFNRCLQGVGTIDRAEVERRLQEIDAPQRTRRR